MNTDAYTLLSCISPLSFNAVCQKIQRSIVRKKRLLLFPINIHSLKLIWEQDKGNVFQNAHILFPDGTLIVWLLKHLHKETGGRVSGTDIVDCILRTPGIRIYLFGATKQTIHAIQKAYYNQTNARIVGYYCPSSHLIQRTHTLTRIERDIQKFHPDVLFVALGQPKQEEWLAHNFPKLHVTIGISVGSALEILSGEKPRAPYFLRTHGFEWFWRVILEPKRLGLRYLSDCLFIVNQILRPSKLL